LERKITALILKIAFESPKQSDIATRKALFATRNVCADLKSSEIWLSPGCFATRKVGIATRNTLLFLCALFPVFLLKSLGFKPCLNLACPQAKSKLKA